MASQPVPPPPSWWSWAFWAAAAGLAVLFVFAAWHLVSTHNPVCNALFPARRSDLPSYWFVFAGIAAFVVGSLSSQYQLEPQGRGRWPRFRGRLPGSQQELGEGEFSSSSAVLAINLGVAAFLFLTTALMLYEAWTLGTGRWPITYYVRCANDAGPLITLVGVAGFAFIIGRWMWVFTDAAPRRSSSRHKSSEEKKPS